jgi:DNA modification methylase
VNLALFPDTHSLQKEETHLSIIPVSVIEIGAQGKRKNEDHNATSSRANYSPFPTEIATLCCEFYLRDAKVVFDPFAGWGERGAAVIASGKEYIGYDTSSAAINKAKADYCVTNTLANSMFEQIPVFDGLFTCPPYWNLEKYESGAGIDRCANWQTFCCELELIFTRSYAAAMSGTTFCVMVGDWRKNHIYYDLEYEVCSMFKNLGAKIIDKVVVSRSKVSKIKIMLPQAKRLGYSVRVHENLLVFKKP